MSRRKGTKKRIEYDPDIPRCGNCDHFKKEFYVLKDSLPRWFPSSCKMHGFVTKEFGVCNDWCGKDGRGLDKAVQSIAQPIDKRNQ